MCADSVYRDGIRLLSHAICPLVLTPYQFFIHKFLIESAVLARLADEEVHIEGFAGTNPLVADSVLESAHDQDARIMIAYRIMLVCIRLVARSTIILGIVLIRLLRRLHGTHLDAISGVQNFKDSLTVGRGP
jgi:hypothetical protein